MVRRLGVGFGLWFFGSSRFRIGFRRARVLGVITVFRSWRSEKRRCRRKASPTSYMVIIILIIITVIIIMTMQF